MAKNAEDRFATMNELAMSLDRYLRDEPASSLFPFLSASSPDGIAAEVEGAAAEVIAPGTTPPYHPSHGAPPPAVQIPPAAPGEVDVQDEGTESPSASPTAQWEGVTSSPACDVPLVRFPMRPGQGEHEPVGGRHDEAGDVHLKRLWRAWTEVVVLFALRQTHRHVDPAEYASLHLNLVEACRSRLEATDAGDRPLYEKLLTLAEPWRTMNSVLNLDQEMSFSLMILCRQAEMELHGLPQAARELGDRIATLRESANQPFSFATKCLFALGILTRLGPEPGRVDPHIPATRLVVLTVAVLSHPLWAGHPASRPIQIRTLHACGLWADPGRAQRRRMTPS